MTAWLIVTLLILIGLLLINIEVIFIPGTTVVGIFGALIAGAGVVFSFIYFDNSTGFVVLTGTLVAGLGSIIYFFKKGAWKAMALNDAIEGKVNEGLLKSLATGEEGIAISTLRPYGKAEFKGEQFEVCTLGDYAESGTKVVIVKIESNKILVEPIKS